ncbi:hypothetical protein AB0K47_11235 [Streptomyces tirandamycinicus]|uniref:hypothetical protein n=1 Tax=Streptomyces tirandamycinicus TaxID=2174846 RepID=UPI00343E423E
MSRSIRASLAAQLFPLLMVGLIGAGNRGWTTCGKLGDHVPAYADVWIDWEGRVVQAPGRPTSAV